MSLLVVGSVAFDTIITPTDKAERILGGSATFFSVAASYFTDVKLVAVVGRDFGADHRKVFTDHKVDVEGLQIAEGKTFHWVGEYMKDMNTRVTHTTELNVFESFRPELPARYKESEFIFLANIDPELQLSVLEQAVKPKFVACDTMQLWIDTRLDKLKEVFQRVDMIIINDEEAESLTGESSILLAAEKLLHMGPDYLIIKRGEYGAIVFSREDQFWAPALLLPSVKDPTGAGDSFAGGMMGYLAGNGEVTARTLTRAIYYGTVMASYACEDFSLGALKSLARKNIEERYQELLKLTQLEV